MSDLGYRRDIDGLRALAVVPVVLFHAGVPGFGGGFVGVDIFFVISGYLISTIMYRELSDGRYSVAGFYERRIRRIVPAAVAMLVATSVAAWIYYTPSELSAFGSRLAATALFAINIYLPHILDYFGPRADQVELLHFWSLAVEEQFYIVFPLLIGWSWRAGGRRRTGWLLAVATFLSLAYACYGLYRFPVYAFYSSFSRAWELLIGALLALTPVPTLRNSARALLAALGLVLIVASVVLYDGTIAFPGWAAMPPCIGAALVIQAGRGGERPSFSQIVFENAPAVGIGRISYSLYLWHWPIFVFLRLLSGDRALPAMTTVAALAATFLAAFFSYRFIETPFRRPLEVKPKVPRQTLIKGFAALVLLAIFGGGLMATHGAPWRVTPIVRVADAASAERPEYRSCIAGSARQKLRDDCPAGAFDTALWGDSHAGHYFPAINAIVTARGGRIGYFGKPSCPPLTDTLVARIPPHSPMAFVPIDLREGETCRATNRAVLASLLGRPEVKTVVIAAAWSFFSEASDIASGEGRFAMVPGNPLLTRDASRVALRRGLQLSVAALTRSGKHVVLLGQVPDGLTSPSRCLARALMLGNGNANCTRDRAAAIARLGYSNGLLTDLSRQPGVASFIASDRLCRGPTCVVRAGTIFIYRDADHLSREGALLLAPAIAPLMEPANATLSR